MSRLPRHARLAVLALLSTLGAVLLIGQPAQAARTAMTAARPLPHSPAATAPSLHLAAGRTAKLRTTDGGMVAQAITAGTLHNRATGRCVDDSLAYGLRPIACNGQNYQTWYFDWGNVQTIRNANTNRCVDDSPDYGLRSFTCTDYSYQTGYQGWLDYQVFDGNGAYLGDMFQNFYTGNCIDDSVAFGLRSFECNAEDFQLFT